MGPAARCGACLSPHPFSFKELERTSPPPKYPIVLNPTPMDHIPRLYQPHVQIGEEWVRGAAAFVQLGVMRGHQYTSFRCLVWPSKIQCCGTSSCRPLKGNQTAQSAYPLGSCDGVQMNLKSMSPSCCGHAVEWVQFSRSGWVSQVHLCPGYAQGRTCGSGSGLGGGK